MDSDCRYPFESCLCRHPKKELAVIDPKSFRRDPKQTESGRPVAGIAAVRVDTTGLVLEELRPCSA